MVSAIVIGVFSTALMMAVAAYLMNSAQSESARRHKNEIRNAAESGLEFALANFGNATGANFTIPGSTFVGSSGSSSNASIMSQLSVNVSIRPYSVGEMSQFAVWSPLYSIAIDPKNPKSILYDKTNPAGTVTAWKVIESKATMGGISRTIRVIAEPMYEVTPDTQGFSTPDNYLNFGAFGDEALNLGAGDNIQWLGNDPRNSSRSDFLLNLATNGSMNLGSDTVVQGNLRQFSADSLSMSSRSFVLGNLQSKNSVATLIDANARAFSPSMTAPDAPNALPFYVTTTPPANIFNGAADSLTFDGNNIVSFNSTGDNSGGFGPIQSSNSLSSATIPPVPSGHGAESIPQISELASSGSQLNSVSGDWQTGSLTTDGLSNGQTVNLSDHLTSTDSSGNSNPIRIFVNDSDNPASGSKAIDIDAGKLTHSADPSSLQLWYSGNRDVSITIPSGSEFAATIYAPNAKVELKGANGTFKGAITGKTTSFDPSMTLRLLSNFNDASAGPSKSAGLTYTGANSTTPTVSGYRIVSWTELN